jgi:exodeoxyribonuclease VII large subunit
VPVVSGVGHETDFTIADFCADLRAPTPTAAAELVSAPRATWLGALDLLEDRLEDALRSRLDGLGQRLDLAAGRLGRPSTLMARQRLAGAHLAQRLHFAALTRLQRLHQAQDRVAAALPLQLGQAVEGQRRRQAQAALRLQLLDPSLVLRRGYAWLSDRGGHALTSVGQLVPGDTVTARLADGQAALHVAGVERTRPHPTPEG